MELPDKLLPGDLIEMRRRVRAASDAQAKYRQLRSLRLDALDLPLLRDARSRLGAGLPDPHRACSQALGFPVYEVRDRAGAGWRGAIIVDKGSPWLVYADSHDKFHSRAPSALKTLHNANKLAPTSIDLRLKAADDNDSLDRQQQLALLDAMLVALGDAVAARADTSVDMSATRVPEALLSIGIDDVPADGWDVQDAHTHADVVSVALTLNTTNADDRRWVIATCLQFLQPDARQIESHFDSRLTSIIMLSRARLIQMLATHHEPTTYEPALAHRVVPTTLHYADKSGLTKAFVHGCAIRAVCGQWWVPAGSDETFPELPICEDCEAELPVAQALKALLRDSPR